LFWQKQEEERILNEIKLKAQSSKSASDDWLLDMISSVESTEDILKQRALDFMYDLQSRISKVQQGVPLKRPHFVAKSSNPQPSAVDNTTDSERDPDDEYSLREYESDEGEGVGSDDADENREADMTELNLPKIFYCSRTHSQIAQFVSEIRRTEFASVRCITLGSRRNMCINPDVNSLTSDTAVSEKCLDMMRNKKKTSSRKILSVADGKKRVVIGEDEVKGTSSRCGYHCSARESRFMEHALGKVRDIEELVSLGGQLSACPYYGSRKAIAAAQVICLPYTMMLQESQRRALGISLSGNVVIFDEAHNIVDATNSTHSALLLRSQILKAQEAVKMYLTRFRAVLTGKNLYHINILAALLQSFKTFLKRKEKAWTIAREEDHASHPQHRDSFSESDISVSNVNSFVFDTSLDNINLLKLQKHAAATQLVQKVSGFAENQYRRNQLTAAAAAADIGSAALREQASSANSFHTARHADRSQHAVGYQHALRAVLSLLECLGNRESDGRLFIGPRSSLDRSFLEEEVRGVANKKHGTEAHSKSTINQSYNPSASSTEPSSMGTSGDSQDWAISFVLMNPAGHFKAIADEARSVLLVGGTLQPFSHISSQLFPHVPSHLPSQSPASAAGTSAMYGEGPGPPHAQEKNPTASTPHPTHKKTMSSFACGHIVSPSHVLACAVSAGVGGLPLDFRHSSRQSPATIKELGDTLIAIMERIPHGVVVFFTSYSYMEYVNEEWRKSYTLHRLRGVKPVYVEHRTGSKDKGSTASGESTWAQYSAAATASERGACLFSVMGGKLSEGINFSDNLARAVIVVGLPYPDVKDPVLREKMSYADACQPGRGRDLYEAMCMKSVNQSIGRSIRHANDFACVILLDGRYAQHRIVSQLPTWISQQLVAHDSFNTMATAIANFFTCFFSSPQT
jgi:chromosome transmission fidelity protein 1